MGNVKSAHESLRAVTCALLLGAAASVPSQTHANAITLGTVVDHTTCSRSGPGSDRNCTWEYEAFSEDVNGVPLGPERALFKIVAQSSADRTNSDISTSHAKADLVVSLDLPYTVTRTVTVAPAAGGGFIARVPIQTLSLSFGFSGVSGTLSNLLAGHESATIGNATVQSIGGLFSPVTVPSTTFWQPGDPVPSCPPAPGTFCDYGLSDVVGLITLLLPNSTRLVFEEKSSAATFAAGAGIGEIDTASQLPGSYSTWSDFASPFADYASTGSIEQSMTDILRIQFQLTAESWHSCSTIIILICTGFGGESMASAGMPSNMGDFLLDDIFEGAGGSFDLTLEGAGFLIDASIAQSGESQLLLAGASIAVPEPATLALLGLGMVALGFCRRKSGLGIGHQRARYDRGQVLQSSTHEHFRT